MTELTDKENIMLGVIRAAALAGNPCPTNRAFADAAGTAAIGRISIRMEGLRKKGILNIERAYHQRKVTIIAEGIATADIVPPRKKRKAFPVKIKKERQPPFVMPKARDRAPEDFIKTLDLTATDCRYIYNEDRKAPDWCGEPVKKGFSYCLKHATSCFQKVDKSDKAA